MENNNPWNQSRGDRPRFIKSSDGPVDIRSIALTGIFILALFYTLYIAKSVFLPIILALMLNFLLTPVVRGLKQIHIRESISSGLLLIALLGTIVFGIAQLTEPASEWMVKVPQSLHQLQLKLRPIQEPIEKIGDATEQVENMVKITEDKKTQKVAIKKYNLFSILLTSTTQFALGAIVMFILLYFLLSSGDLFLRKLIRALPSFEDKKQAVEIFRDTEDNISRYLITITLINIGLGIAVGVGLFLIGMPNFILWGAMVAALNYIPYLGGVIGIIILTLAANLTFDSTASTLMVPLIYLSLNMLEGYLITPQILGRRFTINPVVIFISLILWGWLWGIAGALLAAPILVVLKIFCDRIEPLKPIGAFLGR